MNEIEKMMQNANVKKKWNSTPYGGIEEYYPPFTAEKQLELYCYILNSRNNLVITYAKVPLTIEIFAENLAKSVNNLWQDLTEVEKQQVKGILE